MSVRISVLRIVRPLRVDTSGAGACHELVGDADGPCRVTPLTAYRAPAVYRAKRTIRQRASRGVPAVSDGDDASWSAAGGGLEPSAVSTRAARVGVAKTSTTHKYSLMFIDITTSVSVTGEAGADGLHVGAGAGARVPRAVVTPPEEIALTSSDCPTAVSVVNVDHQRVEAAIRELLSAVGEDPNRPGLLETPTRVARAYGEMFAGLFIDPDEVLTTTFNEQHGELVLVKDIPVFSTCEHHLVAFRGVAHVGYIPGGDGRVTGLSKIARVVDLYAKRPQVQERLTSQVADAMMRKLDPQGAIVVIEAEHLCMAMRGIRKPGAVTTTSAVRGTFKTDRASRSEALSLMRRK